MSIAKLRMKQEQLWLKNVFSHFSVNDKPHINKLHCDGFETKFSALFPSESPAFTCQHQVIHSLNDISHSNTFDKDNPAHTHHYDGYDWKYSDDMQWIPPDHSLHTLQLQSHEITSALLTQVYPEFKPTINHTSPTNINNNSTSTPNKIFIKMQSDSGANTSATDNLGLLHDVVFIDPININSASKDAKPMVMTAVGRLKLRTSTIGQTFSPLCFYSPDVDGTIISPDAIAREFKDTFSGFSKVCNTHSNQGLLFFDAKDNPDDTVVLPLRSFGNNLWYHDATMDGTLPYIMNTKSSVPNSTTYSQSSSSPYLQPSSSQHKPCINKLSHAAEHELWHQRLAHPGTNAMNTIHHHAINVPKLRGNSFWKCPSCMACKSTKSYHIRNNHKSNKKVTLSDLLEPTEYDDLSLPTALPGQHFHFDFGFVRSKTFHWKDKDGRTQTSIDGKNAYLLAIDRKTRYMWVFISSSKQPPLEFCEQLLTKFRASTTHRTVRCDQGELATSKAFNEMLSKVGFTLEVTGSNNSKQNGIAERPHRTLAQMVRCLLHSSGLGPEYWSYALLHAVYIKNRLPHSAISMTPFQAITGKKPDLGGLRIFGSRVVSQSTVRRTGKLDLNHVRHGIFIGHTGTKRNVYYIDDDSRKPKIGSYIEFDEAHMSVPAQHAPLAAQALQRVGYAVEEKQVNDSLQHLNVQLLTKTARTLQPSNTSGEFIVPLDISPTVIKPTETKLISTGIAIDIPEGHNFTLKQQTLDYQPNISVYEGTLHSSTELFLIVANNGTSDVILTRDDHIANIQIHQSATLKLLTTKCPSFPSLSRPKRKQPYRRAKTPTINQVLMHQSNQLNSNVHKHDHMQLSLDLPYDLELSSDPYDSHTHRIVRLDSRSPTLGMKIENCDKRNLPILKACLPGHPSARIPNWRLELRNSYITQINDEPVKSKVDIIKAIASSRLLKMKDIKITFSTLDRQSLHPQLGIPQLYHDQMHIIAQHITNIQQEQKFLQELTDGNAIPFQSSTTRFNINKLKKKHNTFTLKELKKRDDWVEWNASIFKQLDQYYSQNTFDEPEPLPKGANLLSLCWVYLIKTGCLTKKARCVCNGSPRFRGTVTLAETYASALEQTGGRCFWAASAINNYIILGADASNAFAEAPPPKAPLYVRIDENYKRWYTQKFPDKPPLPDDYVLRVRKALQGHPESPRLWATLIDKVIKNLNLKPCTHEPNLYFTDDYKGTGKRVLFLRQVDDFAIACETQEIANMVVTDINSKMTIDVKHLGLITRYNGVDVEQRREYIKIHSTTYIDKLISQHKWLQNDTEHSHSFPLPMNPDNKYQHRLETATPMTKQQKADLEQTLQFTYRQGVGELIYAMITSRPDISYAIIKLSQYATKPARIHFEALVQLYRYLKSTRTDGIYYWRECPRLDLPKGDIPVLKTDANYNENAVETRKSKNVQTLQAYVDSDYASDTHHRRSVSGFHMQLAGGTILYKTKFQSIIAQSSTEAEFIAAADAGKSILYLRTIMDEIGIPQHHATILYEDNQGALLMAQAGQPTKRTKHVDIKHFALQSWVERDLLTMKRINTSDNSADALTKATARTLFYRHNNHIMGRIIPSYVSYVTQSKRDIKNGSKINYLAQNVYTMNDPQFCAGGDVI